MTSDTERAHATEGDDERTVVGAFDRVETARAAAEALHDEGFHQTWIGVTHIEDVDSASSADTTVQSADESVAAKIGRFFSGTANGASLTDALMQHGVTEEDARRVDASIEPADVVLTVHGSNHPALAAQIITGFEGDVLAGTTTSDTLDPDTRTALRAAREQPATIRVTNEEFFVTRSVGISDADEWTVDESTGAPRSLGTSGTPHDADAPV
jgi:hypothetical protein